MQQAEFMLSDGSRQMVDVVPDLFGGYTVEIPADATRFAAIPWHMARRSEGGWFGRSRRPHLDHVESTAPLRR